MSAIRVGHWRSYRLPDLKRVPERAGVYAIYHAGELVYVGMAANLADRLRGHSRLPARDGRAKARPWLPQTRDVVVKVRVERFYGERATLELRLLRRLAPRLNSVNTRRAA